MSYVLGESVPVPVAKALISSLKGPRIDPITKKPGANHGGLDFAVPVGTPVFAAAAGKVLAATFENEGGNYIILLHDNGRKSAYLHLNKFLVSAGQRVAEGQQIAESGNTGARTTGAHLHFEIREPAKPSDKRLDPLDYLPGSFRVTDSIARAIGRSTVSGSSGILGLLVAAGAAYGGYRYLRKKSR